ncbi:MAG: hypothetical protein AAFY08_03325 [Planctomycetota bacterium]
MRKRLKQLGILWRAHTTPIRPPRVIVLGCQKSGTSAIAALLGRATGLDAQIDFSRDFARPRFPDVLAGRMTLDAYLRRNAYDMRAPIVKEPSLTLLYEPLKRRFPQTPFVFVMRHPLDNIRSIFDRIGVPGTVTDGSVDGIESSAWRFIMSGADLKDPPGDLVSIAAMRWVKYNEVYDNQREAFQLVRYEEFMQDKQRVIESLADRLGLDIAADIASLVDVRYQRSGKRITDYREYFGELNYAKIRQIVAPLASILDYEVASP